MKSVVFGSLNIKVPKLIRFLFPYKEKQLYLLHKLALKNKVLYILIQNIIVLTIINWLSQGMSGMDKGELFFHILCSITFFCFFFLISPLGFLFSLIVAHSVNWILNSHFWTFARFLHIRVNTTKKTSNYLDKLSSRVNACSCFLYVFIIGGISRKKKFSYSSDIDIKFIRRKGLLNWFFSNVFLLREKIYCFLNIIPLDAYVFDNIASLENKMSSIEEPMLFYTNPVISANSKKFPKKYRTNHE